MRHLHPYPQQQQVSPESDLDKLTSVLGLLHPFQQDAQQQQQQQMATILHLLGLQQTQQNDAASLGLHQQQVNQEGQFHNAELAQRDKQFGQSMNKEALHALLSHYLSDPTLPIEQKNALVGTIVPEMLPGLNAMQDVGVKSATNKAAPIFSALYNTYKNDNPKLKESINMIKPTMSSEAFNNQDWQGLNAGLPAEQPQGFLGRMFGSKPPQNPQQTQQGAPTFDMTGAPTNVDNSQSLMKLWKYISTGNNNALYQ